MTGPCDCGADDCARCYPGCRDRVRCQRCGTESVRFQAEMDGWQTDGARWTCAECISERNGHVSL